VTDADALHAAFDDLRATMPPLRGVVHAAGTLADATVDRMDPARLQAALAPKLDGGWNLHAATLDDPLDFFVSFSSVAGVLGLSGQSNYAAGNAFLDALAHARRATGRPGLSIDWGPWSDIGLAAVEAGRGDRLAERGLMSITPDEALDVFERLLATERTQVAAMRFDVGRWLASGASTGLLDGLAESAPATAATGDLRARLADTPPGPRRRGALEEAIRVELALVLRTSAERIDRTRPLESMGLDSLMSLEFRNRLEAETGLKLSATLAFNYPTVAILAEHLASRLELELDAADTGPGTGTDTDTGTGATASAPTGSPADGPGDTASELVASELSAAEVEALLGEELAAVERLLESDGRTT
jgi:acyl carrier protein